MKTIFYIEQIESYNFKKYYKYKVKFEIPFPIGFIPGVLISENELELDKKYKMEITLSEE